MRNTLLSLSFLLVAGCGSPAGESQTACAPNRIPIASLDDRLSELVPSLLQEFNVPGAAVVIVTDGQVELLRGFGVLRAEDQKPVNERTIFQAASLSKPVVAYGVHVLVHEERLDLDRPLIEYLNGPYVDDPRIAQVTARMALSHTTGFPNWRPRSWTDHPGPLKFKSDPGSRFRYSGEGYVYLQRVVERVTGESLDVYLKSAVLEPLGMSSSSFVWEEEFERIYASPHDGDGLPQEKDRPSEALAAGTLNSTATDYARFLQAILVDDSDRSLPLPADAIDVMLEPQSKIDDDLGWSLGWGIERAGDGLVFWQWGDDEGFKAIAAGSRSRRTAIAVFTNGDWGLHVARPIVELHLGNCQFLDFRMLRYRRGWWSILGLSILSSRSSVQSASD